MSTITDERVRELRWEHGDYRWDSIMPASTLRVGEFLAICDELLQRRQAEEWQPIETAPKHGEILVCGGTFTHSSGDYPYWKTKGVAMVHWDTDEWRGEDHEDGYYLYRPTYWRVLPPPPDSAIQGEG